MKLGITTVDGVEHFSESAPSDQASDEDMEGMRRLFRDFPKMANLHLEVDGEEIYFNPANIICVKIYP